VRWRCSHELGPWGGPYRELALEARRPLQSLGPYFDPDGVGEGRFEVHEHYCPGCVVPLQIEVARPDDPLLVDVELELAGAAKCRDSPCRRRPADEGGSCSGCRSPGLTGFAGVHPLDDARHYRGERPDVDAAAPESAVRVAERVLEDAGRARHRIEPHTAKRARVACQPGTWDAALVAEVRDRPP
jgi:Acetone carboxylase gamma subunit